MNIAWIQYDIAWQDQQANLDYLTKTIAENKKAIDLLVLPEMFDTGFVMNPDSIENRDQDLTVEWMQETALKYNCAVMGSVVYHLGNSFYNRLFITNGEEVMDYDKNHLFSLSGEDKAYEEGETVLDMHWKEMKLRPLICYDLRFPEISRNTEGIDLLIYVANWPETRILQWESLLQARAIENQCYVLGVNRIGSDGNDLSYNGHSILYSFDGTVIKDSGDKEGLFSAAIEKTTLDSYRKKLPFLKDCKLN